jgi:hypothetical protein
MREKQKKEVNNLSFIIPILFYHGGNGSLVVKSLGEYFDQNIIIKELVSFIISENGVDAEILDYGITFSHQITDNLDFNQIMT